MKGATHVCMNEWALRLIGMGKEHPFPFLGFNFCYYYYCFLSSVLSEPLSEMPSSGMSTRAERGEIHVPGLPLVFASTSPADSLQSATPLIVSVQEQKQLQHPSHLHPRSKLWAGGHPLRTNATTRKAQAIFSNSKTMHTLLSLPHFINITF